MPTYCGYIAIIGRPNVGKSTLLNALLGKKISITSRKPQTTRHKILGIKTRKDTQFIYVDTPGIHEAQAKLINQYMNRTALSALKDVDVVVWVIEASHLSDEDKWILEKLKKIKAPILIAMNKIDILDNQDDILIFIDKLSKEIPNAEFIPLSAKKEFNLNELEKTIQQRLPESPFYFDKDAITDRPHSFMSAEMIREKLIRLLSKELPYVTTVSVESMQKKKKILHISAVIWVEKEGQKKIIIGESGETIKKIGTRARLSMEKYFEQKIFLTLWVKVKSHWSRNETFLKEILQ
jgi:GTP-binding protein Era